ncbi:hypothetical protein J6590_076828 [Homalodisca vitripennis]|nr:hypothetical protein J6590_076828 [Homalodisca vitripennis]
MSDSSLETAYRFKLRARPNFDLRPEDSHLSSRSDLGSVPRSGTSKAGPAAPVVLALQHPVTDRVHRNHAESLTHFKAGPFPTRAAEERVFRVRPEVAVTTQKHCEVVIHLAMPPFYPRLDLFDKSGSPTVASYLEGISLEPTLKSSMPQSLGAATIIICLNRVNPHDRAFQHLGYSKDLAEYPPGKPAAEAAPFIKNVIDTICMTTARTISRAFFHFAFWYALLDTNTRGSVFISSTENQPRGALKLDDTAFFDHSGTGAFTLWQKVSRKGRDAVSMTIDGTPEQAASILFHSVWGTYSEDLNVLEYMTGKTFPTRSELGNCFQGALKKLPVECEAWNIKYYAKLSSACQITLSQTGNEQIFINPRFSGKRVTAKQRVYLEAPADPERAAYIQTTVGRTKRSTKTPKAALAQESVRATHVWTANDSNTKQSCVAQRDPRHQSEACDLQCSRLCKPDQGLPARVSYNISRPWPWLGYFKTIPGVVGRTPSSFAHLALRA